MKIPHLALALSLTLGACASPETFMSQCNGNLQCAQSLASAADTATGNNVALGILAFGALLVGVAAATAPTHTYIVPVQCNAWGCW